MAFINIRKEVILCVIEEDREDAVCVEGVAVSALPILNVEPGEGCESNVV